MFQLLTRAAKPAQVHPRRIGHLGGSRSRELIFFFNFFFLKSLFLLLYGGSVLGKGGVSFNGREFENCGWVIARWVSTSLGRPGPDVSDVAYGEIKSFFNYCNI